MHRSYIFILGENNLELVDFESIFSKNSTVYNTGEIIKILFYFGYYEEEEITKYHLLLYTNNGTKDLFYYQISEYFTDEEMKYLSYIINNHINTKMR